jgi:hypothetical protein
MCAVCAAALPWPVATLDNGVVRLPPLGWNSWCSFGPCSTDICTESQVNDTLTAIVSNGMLALGYNYFTLDVTCAHGNLWLASPNAQRLVARGGALYLAPC